MVMESLLAPGLHGAPAPRNATDIVGGVASFLLIRVYDSWPTYLAIVVGTTALFLVQRLVAIRVDPREPPVLKPAVPFVGHIYRLLTRQTLFYSDL